MKIFCVLLLIAPMCLAYATQEEINNARITIEKALHDQSEFCLNHEKYQIPEFDEKIALTKLTYDGKTFPLYVFRSNDYVSDILLKGDMWEKDQFDSINAFVKKYTSDHKITNLRSRIFVDIGANLGLYTIIFGLMGFKVISFEPMPENIYLLRKNLCINPEVSAIIIPQGVGQKEAQCKLYTHSTNYLDGIVLCDDSIKTDYILKGSFPVVRIDPYAELFSNITVIKIDIEGGEYDAIKGGKKLFLELKVPYIQAEITPSLIAVRGGNTAELLLDFHNAGYSASVDFKNRNKLSEEKLRNPTFLGISQDVIFTYDP